MAKAEHFEDLEVWQFARRLTVKIHALVRQEPLARDYAFRDQMCRAAISIVSNIAEGFERRTNTQFLQFLDIANGSAGELRAQLYIAPDLAYITPAQFNETFADVTAIGKMLTALIRYLRLHPTPTPKKHPPNHPTPHPTTYPPNHQTTKPPNHQTPHPPSP